MKYLILLFLLAIGPAFAGVNESCTKMVRLADYAYQHLHDGMTPDEVARSVPKTWYPVANTSVTDKDSLKAFITYILHKFYMADRHDMIFAIQIECYTALEN